MVAMQPSSAMWRGGPAPRLAWIRAGLGCALLLALAGCSPAKDADSEQGPEEAPAEAEAGPASAGPLEPELRLDGFRLGSAVDAEGAIPAARQTQAFAPGESVYVSMAVSDAPVNAAVHVVFYDEAGEKVTEDEKKVPAQARYLYFDAGDTTGWKPGEYRVEIAVDGEVVHDAELTVADARDEPLGEPG